MLHEATLHDQPVCHPGAAQRVRGRIRHRHAATGWMLAARCASGMLVACLLMAGCGAPTGAPEPSASFFSATTEGEGDEVTISTSGETVVVDVQSRSGIGAATVDLVSGTAPAHIIVRLHLRGLETFRLSSDQTVVVATVSSGDDRSVFQHVELADGSTRPIASDSPFWLDIQIASTQATPAFLLQPRSFAIRLPQGLVNERRRSFTIRWIDFYR